MGFFCVCVCMGSTFSPSCSPIIFCVFLFFASRGPKERQLGPPRPPEEGDGGGAGEAADYALLRPAAAAHQLSCALSLQPRLRSDRQTSEKRLTSDHPALRNAGDRTVFHPLPGCDPDRTQSLFHSLGCNKGFISVSPLG